MKTEGLLVFLGVVGIALSTSEDTCGTEVPSSWDDGWPITVPVDGEPMVQGTFDDQGPIWWVLDTGASMTYADMTLTHSAGFVKADITIGPLGFRNHNVGSVDLSEAEAFIGWDIGGLAGQDIFADRFIAVDYGGLEAYFLDDVPTDPPPGVLTTAPGELPYDIVSLIPISTVTLEEDLPVPLITDTGSGVTLITDDIFEAIDDGTLPRLYGYVWATTYGAGGSFVTRIPSIRAGDYEVRESWAVVVPADNAFFQLLEVSGIDAKGFLGYPFYRHFVFGVDGMTKRYVMWPLETPRIDENEWHRVGIEPSWRDGGFMVEMVYRPSDAAAQGIEVGDQLTAIDGTDLSGATLDDVKLLLRGEVGTARTLTVVHDGEVRDHEVLVQDLLPGQPSVVYIGETNAQPLPSLTMSRQ